LFQKSYQPKKCPLTRKEINQRCYEWVLEPLHPAITKDMEDDSLVLERDAGPGTVVSGKEVINLSSTKYIGLIGHGKITKACNATLKNRD
jgi:serine palmitoyltransferase